MHKSQSFLEPLTLLRQALLDVRESLTRTEPPGVGHLGRDERIEERFEELAEDFQRQFERTLEERTAERIERSVALASGAARRRTGEQLNQAVRRLSQAEDIQQWNTALLDASAQFSGRSALFHLSGGELIAAGCRGFTDETALQELIDIRIPLASAPAFENAALSRDTVVAIRTAGELSDTLAAILGPSAEGKAYLFPVLKRTVPVAILYAEAGARAVEMNALELLSTAAGMAAPWQPASGNSQELVTIAGAGRHLPSHAREGFDEPPGGDGELHQRARQFARIQVAEMKFRNSQAVESGTAERNLYRALRVEIDSARENYRRQFLAASAGLMIDYLHRELLLTLANDDVSILGPDYPGPLE